MNGRRRGLRTPAQAANFVRREERRMQAEADAERLDPHVANQLRQMIKLVGKERLVKFTKEQP